jgi:hypothetical protein
VRAIPRCRPVMAFPLVTACSGAHLGFVRRGRRRISKFSPPDRPAAEVTMPQRCPIPTTPSE